MAIDTTKDFSKKIPSVNKVNNFLRALLNGEPLNMVIGRYGRQVAFAEGTQSNFTYRYYGGTLSVTYTDGREKPIEKKVDKKYFIVWVEGLSMERGEKIKQLTNTGFDYTTKMSEAMRVKKDDIFQLKRYMKRHGIADWVLESPNTFIPTSYAPSGTLLNSKKIAF